MVLLQQIKGKTVGNKHCFQPEKLIIPVLYQPLLISRAEIMRIIEHNFGTPGFISGEIPFTWTNYYAPEMGDSLIRFFVTLEESIDPSRLAAVKIRTNEIENQFLVTGGRSVNLDPGILNLSRLILATTKDRSHRIPLADGIYGEVTLMYSSGAWQSFPWTYADFRSPEYAEVLTRIRSDFREELRRRKTAESSIDTKTGTS